MSELLSFNINWEKEAGDCQTCTACKEPIYGNKYTCIMEAGGKSSQADICLCEPCYLQKISVSEE